MLTLYADGASRGNPGPASFGAAVFQGETLIASIAETLGIRTNNYAEYSAVIAGLKHIVDHKLGDRVLVRMDSKLVVEQLSGRWQIKHPELRELARVAQGLLKNLEVKFEWIPRELNFVADELANQALDGAVISQPDFAPKELARVQPRSIRAPRVVTEPTVIYLVRHGHTESTESNLVSGSKDNPGLSKLGIRDANAAASALNLHASQFDLAPPSLVVHSDLARTAQTAKQIATSLSIPARPDSRLREISFGDWEGRSMPDLETSFPTEISAWRGSAQVCPPGGESLVELEDRVMASLRDLVVEFEGGSIAIVSHMMPLRAMVKKALGGSAAAHWSLQFAPGSISVLRFFGTEFAEVFSLNSCEHLPRD